MKRQIYIISQFIADEDDNILGDWNIETDGFYDLEFTNYKEAKKCFDVVKNELPECLDYYREKAGGRKIHMTTEIMGRPQAITENWEWGTYYQASVDIE